jgi:hypothetical protein
VVEVLRERRAERRARALAAAGPAPRLPRSPLGAAVDARLAVRAGVRLDDFLRHRLARYAARLPVALEALPVTVDIAGGEAVIRPRARPRSFGPRPEAAAGAAARESWAARELREAEAELDRLDACAGAAHARLEAVEVELAAAVAQGTVVARPAVDASAEQLGRPPVPPAAPILALRAFAGALLAAEAWRFSGPVLAAAGAAPAGGLEEALRAAPVGAGLALVLAAGGGAAAFAFAWLALSRAADALAATAETGRRPLLLVTAAGTGALVPAIAAATAAPARWAQLALLGAVPFAGAVLVRVARALETRRAAAATLALAWDRERAREALERGRREEVWHLAAEALRDALAAREDARRRLARLHRAAAAAERTARLSALADAERHDRLAEALACSLELDRYLYVRLAAARAVLPAERPALARAAAPVAAERLGVAG